MQCKKDSTHSEATKTKGYRLYPLLTQIEMMMHAPALAQQFTHLGHPNCSHRILYLLRKIADMTEKYKRKQTNTRKTSKHYMRLGIPLFRKVIISLLTSPVQTACFARLTMLSSVAVAASSLVSRTSREQRLVVKKLRCCCLPRLLVGLECTPARGLCVRNHPNWLEDEQFLLSPLTSQLAILRVHPAPYRSRVTVAAMHHIAAAAQAGKG